MGGVGEKKCSWILLYFTVCMCGIIKIKLMLVEFHSLWWDAMFRLNAKTLIVPDIVDAHGSPYLWEQ